jgi:hypothetical protein
MAEGKEQAQEPAKGQEQVPLFAVEVKMYVDSRGRRIQQRVPVLGKAPEEFHSFGGSALIGYRIPGAEHIQEKVLNFNLPGVTSIEEAFNAFETALDAAVKEDQARIDKVIAEAQKKAEEQAKEQADKAGKAQVDELKAHREKKLILPT